MEVWTLSKFLHTHASQYLSNEIGGDVQTPPHLLYSILGSSHPFMYSVLVTTITNLLESIRKSEDSSSNE